MLPFPALIALLLLAAPVDDPCQPGYARLPGLPPEIQSTMRKIDEQARRQDKEGRTPLHWAAIKDKYGKTALDYAEAGFGKYHRDVARLIRSRGPMRAKE